MKWKMVLLPVLLSFVLYSQNSDVSIEMTQGMVLGGSEVVSPPVGYIQWDGNDFVGWNGIRWVSLTGGNTTPILDIDGNTYETVGIGHQVWLKENLRVTKYNNGEPIQYVPLSSIWDTLTQPAWCWYDNNAGHEEPYGKMYNGYVILDERNICPEGWRIPNRDDLLELSTRLGGSAVAGGKLKVTGNFYWDSTTGATNESNFSAVGAGRRKANGDFSALKIVAEHWLLYQEQLFEFAMIHASGGLDFAELEQDLQEGQSIRCIKSTQ